MNVLIGHCVFIDQNAPCLNNYCMHVNVLLELFVFSDRSIPRLESTMSEYQTELEQLANLVANQVQFEQTAHQNFAKTARLPAKCVEPV